MSPAGESADSWGRLSLTREALGSLVERVTDGDPLPTLVVSADGRDALEASIPGLEEILTPSPHDPGCYRFLLSRPPWSEEAKENFDFTNDADVTAIAQRISDVGREYGRSIGIELDATIDSDLRSTALSRQVFSETLPLIRLGDGTEISSVGPGGYVAIGHASGLRGHAVVGTSSIRPFVIPSQAATWLHVDSIIAAVAGLLDVGLQFDPSFGYWERSWMERQDRIEPVYALLVEDDSPDYPMKRRITIPATVRS
jgi:hypothetical protein